MAWNERERTRTDRDKSDQGQTAEIISMRFLPVLVFTCLCFGSLAVSCLVGWLGVCFGVQRRGKDQDRPEPERQQTNRTNRTHDNYAICPRLLFQLGFAWFSFALQCWGLCFHCRGSFWRGAAAVSAWCCLVSLGFAKLCLKPAAIHCYSLSKSE